VVVVSPGKPDLAAVLEGVQTVEQPAATGLAPAVLLGARLGPAIVLLPDTIFYPNAPTGRLAQALSRGFDIAIAVERVVDEDVSPYGIVEWSGENGRIPRIREKPRPDETSSRWAIAARFGLSARTLYFVKQRVEELSSAGREIDLPPLLDAAIEAGHTAL